jgi:hypothetical protein
MKINKETGELSDFCCKKMAQGTHPPGEYLTFQPQWKDHRSDSPHPAICLFKKGSKLVSDLTTDQAVQIGTELVRIEFCPFCGKLIEFLTIPAQFGKLEGKVREVREKHERDWAKREGVEFERDRAAPRDEFK